ncbi:hypothetical protein GCWU000342_00433 [Shuttleworthella satelles DSM 14600]|uniref:Uncharacterized protein n=1 Tax=Shuttleworthella satelles DSM 14600 TaxID=626523 RepID=C4G8Y5_9FIRM|nr:hypothetical protein GCWU000342_00433 [Shuttleworthia satelles DSM 14600]
MRWYVYRRIISSWLFALFAVDTRILSQIILWQMAPYDKIVLNMQRMHYLMQACL